MQPVMNLQFIYTVYVKYLDIFVHNFPQDTYIIIFLCTSFLKKYLVCAVV